MNPDVASTSLRGDAVAAAVTRMYGRSVVAEQVIHGESFFSVCLRDVTGDRYVAKVGQQPFHPEEVAWQEQLLDRLDSAGVRYQTPAILRDVNGRTVSVLDLTGESESREAMVLSWVDGDLMAQLNRPSLELLADVGRLSATLTQAIGDLDVPFAHRSHHWVLTRSLDSLKTTLDTSANPAQLSQIHEVIDFFKRHCTDTDLAALPQATVHQDLNPHNITVDPLRPNRVQGVIDFNDAVRTARVADVSIAAAYAMFGQDDPGRACAVTVNGFQEVIELTGKEREVILPLAMIRLVVNWATWSQLSGGDSESYAASRMRSTFPMIARVVDSGLEDARDQLLSATR